MASCREGEELDVFGAGEGLAEIDELGERIAVPGDDHGPGFDAAMAVDAGFERAVVDEVVDVDGLGLFDHAGDLNLPRAGVKRAGVVGGVGLVGAELIKVVVVAGLGEGGLRIFEGVLAGDGLELVGGVDGGRGLMRPGMVRAARAAAPKVAAPVRKRRRLWLCCSKTCCWVISEERMVDSRLADLRRSIAGVPFRGQDGCPKDRTPDPATSYSTPTE